MVLVQSERRKAKERKKSEYEMGERKCLMGGNSGQEEVAKSGKGRAHKEREWDGHAALIYK